MTRRPGVQARHSVISLAALARCVRQSNGKNKLEARLSVAACTAKSNSRRSRCALAFSPLTPGNVALIVSNVAAVMTMWITVTPQMGDGQRAGGC
jgi:hypothetical protein